MGGLHGNSWIIMLHVVLYDKTEMHDLGVDHGVNNYYLYHNMSDVGLKNHSR